MNNKMIIRFVLLICVILVASVSVAADVVLDVTKFPTAHPGETVAVPVVISDNTGFISMTLDVNFNERQMTLVGVEDTGLVSGSMHSDVYKSPYRLSWANDTLKNDIKTNGTVAILTFTVNESVDADCYFHIGVPKDGIYNTKGQSVPLEIENKNIKVEGIVLPEPPEVPEEKETETEIIVQPTGEGQNYEKLLEEKTTEQHPAAWENPFTDVSEKDEYYPAVEYVYTHDLFKGVSAKRFAPHSLMTRAMFVTVLGRFYGVDTESRNVSTFGDVKIGEWYTPYVSWAQETGIVKGYSKEKFGVDDYVTVEQACVIMARFADLLELDKGGEKSLDEYNDATKVSDWAQKEMRWAAGSGVYRPDGNRLKPQDKAERKLVAMMFYNFALNFKK